MAPQPDDDPGADATADRAAVLVDLLHRANHRIRRLSLDDVRALGATPSQLRALRHVHRGGPMRVSALAEALGVVPRSATSIADELEELGAVRRRPDPDDRRATLLEVTDRGRRLMAAVSDSRRAALAGVLADLSDRDQNELVRLLTVLAGERKDRADA